LAALTVRWALAEILNAMISFIFHVLKVHYVTFGPPAVKKQNCMHFAEKNIVLVVLRLCMTLLMNMFFSHS